MTEYDYSPEAYEKYLATQARIARWVNATHQTALVGPDVPPTPLGPNENTTLPRNKECKFRSHPSSPPLENSEKSSVKKRSKFIPPRPPTPFEKEFPAALDNSTNIALPSCPTYRYAWSPRSAKASAPHPETAPPGPHERRDSTSRPSYNIVSRELSEPVRPSYIPGYDSDNTYAEERVVRMRSTSFSAAVNRPLNNSSPVAHYHSNYSSPHNHSARNSSPHYPSASAALIPLPVSGPHASSNSLGYPLPVAYRQCPDFEMSRSHTVRIMHQPVDSAPYFCNAPSHSHQRSWHSQSRSRSLSRPPSPGFSTEPQPGSIRVTFPNGKILYMNPPNTDKSRILQVYFLPINTTLWLMVAFSG